MKISNKANPQLLYNLLQEFIKESFNLQGFLVRKLYSMHGTCDTITKRAVFKVYCKFLII